MRQIASPHPCFGLAEAEVGLDIDLTALQMFGYRGFPIVRVFCAIPDDRVAADGEF